MGVDVLCFQCHLIWFRLSLSNRIWYGLTNLQWSVSNYSKYIHQWLAFLENYLLLLPTSFMLDGVFASLSHEPPFPSLYHLWNMKSQQPVSYWYATESKKSVSFCFWSSTSYEDALVITHVNEVSFLPGWDLPLSATISVLQIQITWGLETVCPSWDTLPLHVGQLETLTVKNWFSWHCTLISVVKRSLQATTCSSLVRC